MSLAFQSIMPLNFTHATAHTSRRRHVAISPLKRPPTPPHTDPYITTPACSQTAPRTTAKSPAPPPASSSPVPLTNPPSVTTYPKPSGTPGAFATLSRDCQTVPQLMEKLSTHPRLKDLPALIDDHHGSPTTLTFAQLGARIHTCTHGLLHLGLQPGDLVSLFSENSHRWAIIDQAIMTVGAAAAVRGVAAPAPELRFIFENSTSCALVVEDLAALQRVVDSGVDLTATKFVLLLFGSVDDCASLVPAGVCAASFDEVMRLGETGPPLGHGMPPPRKRRDVMTMLYTSGTTGNPKGVILTHDNILCQLENISLGNLDPHPSEVFVSILPCWHVFERTACYWSLSKGVCVVYSNKRAFRDDLSKYKPHMLISVPRVFENLHATIMSRLRKASPLRKLLFGFFFALSLAFVKSRRKIRGVDVAGAAALVPRLAHMLRVAVLAPLYGIANLLIWRKIRAGLGGRLRICLSGGGTIAGHLEDFFECAGVDICVGYGLTETSPVIANRFGERNVRGTTGLPLPCVEVKLVNPETGQRVGTFGDAGVLHVRGPTVFKEYWNNASATASAFDHEGYFSTGDLAYFADGGDVVISGRSKDVIVLSNGENIEPAGIEDALLASPWIDQVMLVGQDERALGALVVPQLAELVEGGIVSEAFRARVKELVKKCGGERMAEITAVEEELSQDEGFVSAMKAEIKEKNRGRVSYAAQDNIVQVRAVLVPFSVENGMMTQTLKIKKDVVSKIYAEEIGDMFRKD